MMKLNELLNDGIYVLKEKNIDDCHLKARLLLAYLLGKTKEYLVINDREEIDRQKQIEYYALLDRLTSGEPLQYITGHQEFMGMDFFVNKSVLIPQPDTELLVQAVLKYLKHTNRKQRILDLCTGSGAIAISLSKILSEKEIEMVASDISQDALEVVKINCQNHQANVKLIQSDLFEKIDGTFNIIVSNPPYIETETISELSLDVQNEPHIALDGGKDGLDFYRKIGKEARKHLAKEGMLFLEIGYNQKETVREILENNQYKNIICLQDFSGNDRVMIASV